MELKLPQVIFGTSGLGNLFVALAPAEKLNIVRECLRLSNGPVIFDSAGKYGAGLALEVLGNCLKELNVHPDDVVISNKLGWVRTELQSPEPTFEPGVWKNLQYDAVQRISYEGILECFEQGNKLLQGYVPQMVSVHDPDEYLAAAVDETDAQKRYQDVLNAYDALFELKVQGRVKAIGVGAKDWRVVKKIARDIQLDWVMIANSMTIKTHPQELMDFIMQMDNNQVQVINSAVFHSGFLVGSNYFDYHLVTPGTPGTDALIKWRADFFATCHQFNVTPAEACVNFALHVPGVKSIALNTTDAHRVKENLELADVTIPAEFWSSMQSKGLIGDNCVHLLQPVSDTEKIHLSK